MQASEELVFRFSGLKLPERSLGTIALFKLASTSSLVLRFEPNDNAQASTLDFLITHSTRILASEGAARPVLTLERTGARLQFELAQEEDEIYITTLAGAVEELCPFPQQQSSSPPPSLLLEQIATPQLLLSILQDSQATQESFQLLPPAFRTPDGLAEVIRSAQLRHTARCLSEAVLSPELSALFAALHLDPNAAALANVTDPTLALILSLESKYASAV